MRRMRKMMATYDDTCEPLIVGEQQPQIGVKKVTATGAIPSLSHSLLMRQVMMSSSWQIDDDDVDERQLNSGHPTLAERDGSPSKLRRRRSKSNMMRANAITLLLILAVGLATFGPSATVAVESAAAAAAKTIGQGKAFDLAQLQPQQQQLMPQRRQQNPSDQVDSADLPAEFRGLDDDEAPREQSKLAKLCQQTSSVLASVLPAPFGGHKRSILCQFFGQVPMMGPKTPGSSKKLQPAETIAVLQHGHQPPVTLTIGAGHHPIQLVLEHQKQQMQLQQQIQQQQQQQQQQMGHPMQLLRPGFAPVQLPSGVQHQLGGSGDLKSAASVIDYAYHQKLEPPPSMVQRQNQNSQPLKQPIKFNQPLGSAASFRPLSMAAPTLQSSTTGSSQASSSGWRIYNQSPVAGEQQSSTATPTFAASSTMARNGSQAKSIDDNSDKRPKVDSKQHQQQHNSSSTTVAPSPVPRQQQQSSPDLVTAKQTPDLHLARPTIANSPTNIATKRTEALRSTTRSLATGPTTPEPSKEKQQVRIIEVSNNNTDGSPLIVKDLQKIGEAASMGSVASASGAVIKLAKQLALDAKKEVATSPTQRREELVIASINNLTRIAFGNQLRDTVKVINRLIDQQSDLFGGGGGGGGGSKAAGDQPQAESRRAVSVVSSNGLDKSPSGAGSKKAQRPEAGDINTEKVSSAPRKTTSVTTAKTTPKPTKRPKKGDSLRLSSSSSQSSTSTSQRPQEGSKRSTKVNSRVDLSRSLWSSSSMSPLTRKSYATTPKMVQPPKVNDLAYATTVGDLHRDQSPWRRSQQPPGRLLTRPSAHAGVSLKPIVATTTSTTSRPSKVTLGDWRPPQTYPWLLPDKSFSGSDLFQSMGGQSSERVSSTVEAPRKWLQSSTSSGGVGSKQALVLNRLQEPEMSTKQVHKPDSLTTLKMSLTTTTTPSKMIWTSQKEQSRWIPSTITAASPTTTTTTSTTTTTTTSKPSTTLTSASISELIEARASDSISKYTSHWTNEANELLATTTRLRLHRGENMPQIAQTGEFFNAETIANWPERYQTMLEARSTPSLSSTSQQQQVETTRRNGETYDTATTPARHKLDETSANKASTTRALVEPNHQTSMTVLPLNHKLTSTTSMDQATTRPEETTKTYTSSPYVTAQRQTVSGPALAYTLVGPITEGDGDEVHQQNGDKFPLVVSGDDEQVSTTKPPSLANFVANFSSLKAPYLQQEDEDIQQIPIASGRPYVSRKLYELLVPSTRHFVGAQNPLNQQRFNLSALKFLAQNLLSPAGTVNETTTTESYLQEPTNTTTNNNTNANNGGSSATNQQLIDLLESSDNYYDMLVNNTSTNNYTAAANKTVLGGKSILGRAGNLLNDLRQLEQKKAAAIMAAIRYQVPGPLVRPWDLNSDLLRHSLGLSDGLGSTLDSRNDQKEEQEEPMLRNYLRDSLVVAQASKLIKTALAKQRLVSRDVLEARLNGKEVAFVDKRSDQEQNGATRNKSSQPEVAYSFGDHDNQAGVFNGSRHDDADYKPSAQEDQYNLQYQNNRNFTRRWLDKLFNRANASSAAVMLNDDRTISSRGDLVEVTGGEPDGLVVGRSVELDHQSVSAGGDTGAKEVLEAGKEGDKFDCSDKQAGFYPDTSSACQTFYHCSSTGHLLTFNCPQQTRFDERSLKCGPWFEITCDLTRNKHRRPTRFN